MATGKSYGEGEPASNFLRLILIYAHEGPQLERERPLLRTLLSDLHSRKRSSSKNPSAS